MNSKAKKFILPFVAISIVFLFIATVIFLSLEKYYDKYTWAKVVITENGDTGNTVTGDYAKGDVMDVSFAKVNVLKVRTGSNDFIIFATDADIIYNEKVRHKIKLHEGDSVLIKQENNTADLKIESIGGY